MILVLDTETTGLPKNYKAPITDSENWPRLVQIAWRTYENNGEEIDNAEYIIYPDGFEIPEEATKLHGITTERACNDGISLSTALLAFGHDLVKADYVVAHNIAYDTKIIGAEFFRIGMDNLLETKTTICTMLSSVDFCAIPGPRGNKWPKLTELYQVLFAENLEGEHDAAVDCEAAARCFWELFEKGVIVLALQVDPVDEMFPLLSENEIIIGDSTRKALGMEGVRGVEMTDAVPENGIPLCRCCSTKMVLVENKQPGNRTVWECHNPSCEEDCLVTDPIEMTDEQVADFLADFPEADDEINSPIILQRMIVDAYEELSHTRRLFVRAGNRVIKANELLDARKNAALISGEITGSNDIQRKAQLIAVTIEETANVRATEAEERDARFEFDQAQADVEMVRALLRVAELANGGRVER